MSNTTAVVITHVSNFGDQPVIGLRAHQTSAGQILDTVDFGSAAIRGHFGGVSVMGVVQDRISFGNTKVNGVAASGTIFLGFSHFDIGGVDPAVARVLSTTSGAAYDAASPSNFKRLSMTLLVPDGEFSMPARFLSNGVRVNSMAANEVVMLDGAQAEYALSGAIAPTPYTSARQLQVSVRPTRLNWLTNPSFEVSTAGWSANASVTVSRAADATGIYGGQAGTFVASAALAANTLLAQSPSAPALPGQQWSTAVRVKKTGAATGVGILVQVVYLNSSGTAISTTSTSAVLADTGDWETAVTNAGSVVAPAGTASVVLRVLTQRALASGSGIALDGALLERTATAGPIFTGDSGADYLWEQGATVGLGRSYQYTDYANRAYVLRQTLQKNAPLGVIVSPPQFAVLPKE